MMFRVFMYMGAKKMKVSKADGARSSGKAFPLDYKNRTKLDGKIQMKSYKIDFFWIFCFHAGTRQVKMQCMLVNT